MELDLDIQEELRDEWGRRADEEEPSWSRHNDRFVCAASRTKPRRAGGDAIFNANQHTPDRRVDCLNRD